MEVVELCNSFLSDENWSSFIVSICYCRDFVVLRTIIIVKNAKNQFEVILSIKLE